MTFPTTLDSDFGTLVDNVDDAEAVNVNELRRAVEGLEAKVGINSSAVMASLDYKVNNFFVSGRKLYLYENTAPTGWTIVAVTDKVLAVKGGSDAYNVTGGNTGGTWTQPNHTLTIAEMPYHRHLLSAVVSWSGGGSGIAASSTGLSVHTGYTGGDGAHNHGTTYRPAAAVGIIVSKDA